MQNSFEISSCFGNLLTLKISRILLFIGLFVSNAYARGQVFKSDLR